VLSCCELQKSFPGVLAHLFEYDHRFGKYGSDFTFYDYNQPLHLPQQHAQGFDIVVADPPYLVSYTVLICLFFLSRGAVFVSLHVIGHDWELAVLIVSGLRKAFVLVRTHKG
jgi:hypothetical protein